ncbi:MAG: 30S ribosomal protein S6 [Endomicrobium sp.]|jgi:small subunit ribosomal protein S6|nr:30S ribosomal protein S6 [Endomicrobium sp.]
MNYESTFIISSELKINEIEEFILKVRKVIENSYGSVKIIKQLGTKKLAYSINKSCHYGNYIYMEFLGNAETIVALKNFFKFNDLVIRFLIIKKIIIKENQIKKNKELISSLDKGDITKNEPISTKSSIT